MFWIDQEPYYGKHPVETEKPQALAQIREFETEGGQKGSVWFKEKALCQLQVIVPGEGGLHHGKIWKDEATAWDEGQRVIEQWEREEACGRHKFKMNEDATYTCTKCGQYKLGIREGRFDG